jgi:undecaprenyl-diphosphatase
MVQMSVWKIVVLAIVQGLAELLPVSSSAHVVTAEKLLHLDPSAPEMTLLLVFMHTGTMFSVIVYFWSQWREAYFSSLSRFKRTAWQAILATVLTGVIGEAIIKVIEHTLFRDTPKAQIEDLFSRLDLVAPALLAAGLLILFAGLRERSALPDSGGSASSASSLLATSQAAIMGAVQGLCLPFRGFSRSGATISAGMLSGASRMSAERFSFALAVILTPPVVLREVMRLHAAQQISASQVHVAWEMSLLGCALAFLAGLFALKWLSSWLEQGRWYLFGLYCLAASGVVFGLFKAGY